MPRPKHYVPVYRHHKASGQAYVELDGERRYLGKHNGPASLRLYDQLIADWLASGRRSPTPPAGSTKLPPPPPLTIDKLIEAYLPGAREYYSTGDEPTAHYEYVKNAVRLLAKSYGRERCQDFGPRKLSHLRKRMIGKDWTRGYINEQIDRIRRMFRWAVSQELCSSSIFDRLMTLERLRKGRTTAK